MTSEPRSETLPLDDGEETSMEILLTSTVVVLLAHLMRIQDHDAVTGNKLVGNEASKRLASNVQTTYQGMAANVLEQMKDAWKVEGCDNQYDALFKQAKGVRAQ